MPTQNTSFIDMNTARKEWEYLDKVCDYEGYCYCCRLRCMPRIIVSSSYGGVTSTNCIKVYYEREVMNGT